MQGDKESDKETGRADQDPGGQSGPISNQKIQAGAKKDPSQKQEQSTKNRFRLSPEWVMVAFSGALVLTTILQWQAARESIAISRDVFNAANRPYVGVVSIDTSHMGRNAEGSPLASGMRFRVTIKNVGTVPALNYRATWRVFLDGVEQKGEGIPATATTLFPGVPAYLAADIGGISYGPLMKEEITLELQTTVYYEWPGGHHAECERSRYDVSLDSFLNLGACTIE